MNVHAIRAIYRFEMARTRRTLMQSIISPVISTSLYFIVFGAAIGSRIPQVGAISYGAFIVPGLVMLSLLTQSISNASFGIYFPKFTGTIYELLSAPVSTFEIVLVEDKAGLMRKLGKKRLKLHLQGKIDAIPPALAPYQLELSEGGCELTYHYDTKGERTGITSLLSDLRNAGIRISDLDTSQSSLEDIFVSLVRAP